MEKKILVVDDDATDRKRMTTALAKEGYSILEASSAEEALIQARETLPDLVITDVVMPDSTGFDVCRRIKEAFQPQPPLVLIVTGKAEAINIHLANQMGADGFEAKTSDMSCILKAVRYLFSVGSN